MKVYSGLNSVSHEFDDEGRLSNPQKSGSGSRSYSTGSDSRSPAGGSGSSSGSGSKSSSGGSGAIEFDGPAEFDEGFDEDQYQGE